MPERVGKSYVLTFRDAILARIREYAEVYGGAELEVKVTSMVASFNSEIVPLGWKCRLLVGNDGSYGLAVDDVPEAERINAVNAIEAEIAKKGGIVTPEERMTDRQLLIHFSNLVCQYDAARDEELRFLEKNPARDAWDDEQEQQYREIMEDAREHRAKVLMTIDHINARRRP